MSENDNENKVNFDRASFGKVVRFIVNKGFAVAVILLLLVQYFSVLSLGTAVDNLERKTSTLVDDAAAVREFATDLNEVRGLLRLPVKTYGSAVGSDLEAGDVMANGERNTNQLQLALFDYLQHLGDEKEISERKSKNLAEVKALRANEAFLSGVGSRGLVLGGDDESLKFSSDEGLLLGEVVVAEDGGLMIVTMLDEREVKGDLQVEVKAAVLDRGAVLEKAVMELNAAKDMIAGAMVELEGSGVASEKGVSFLKDGSEQAGVITYGILNSSEEIIGEVKLYKKDSRVDLIDLKSGERAQDVNFNESFEDFFGKLDARSVIARKVEEAKAELDETLKDSGFRAMLNQVGLSMGDEAREDDARYYYDILDANGAVLRSVVIEKATGMVNITDPSGVTTDGLLTFESGDDKKKNLELPDVIPNYGDEVVADDGTFNILIGGKNGNLMDTMIFAHVDENNGTVKMISIPRDLHYQGRKINSFPYFYGMPEFKRALTKITGYEVHKYIVVDMYAFIDVVDLLGGIDITLERALIDPSYRTVDNGVVGTLHYEPGTYHLGGVEALRLARSRKTSSDFARAERQQQILEAIQAKARNFGVGNVDTIWQIGRSVLDKTETDMSIDEAISYFFRYQNYEIVSNDVMSSGNILFVPPYITKENCAVLSEEAGGSHSCQTGNQAYTLLPRDSNWNLIKWFFRDKFES
ncbi:hypothetical protein CVV38_01945 [Candidatus Peregrinibacteria bacterium HGW-Peregrinibacteria-1]|jgi:LCP family protein required for cell wall assembly|nr:MAG: hypothetical protein CVV38_01945 [Candidatus Peregrinibacteria bacterium HGW-Peregrinibacteria-1]